MTTADSRLYRAAVRVEGTAALDRPAGVLAAAGRGRLDTPRARAVLGGRWLGHALHPLLTDLPLGTWMSATFLDLTGGKRSRPAAQRLVAAGVVAALPTAAAGLSDWMVANQREQRVGVVHAGANTLALACYAASLAARRRDRHAAGVAWGLLGAGAAGVGGFFGGHLALTRDTAIRSSASARQAAGEVGSESVGEPVAATAPSGATPSSSPSAP